MDSASVRSQVQRGIRFLRVRFSKIESTLKGKVLSILPAPAHMGRVPLRNKYFDPEDLAMYRKQTWELVRFDSDLRAKALDRYTRRQRAWEYATFLSWYPSLQGLRILDIGPGASTFSLFLAQNGASVTTLDLPEPFQNRKAIFQRAASQNMRHCHGTMLSLPFATGAFDVALSVSAIEHLQQYPSDPFQARPYEPFVQDTRCTLREMARVVARGGAIYLTTDSYDPQLQKGDAWWRHGDEVACAYSEQDVEKVFIDELRSRGFEFMGDWSYDFGVVRRDPRRANFRGRYISTWALLMRKVGGGSEKTP